MNRLSFATVLADCVETRYLRAGTGPAVVLLRPLPLPADGADPLVAALAEQYRIFVPELPATLLGENPDEGAALSWIQGVLDCLGINNVLILVSWQMSWLAASLRQEDPDRVQGIAVLLEDGKVETVRAAVGGFFGSSMTA